MFRQIRKILSLSDARDHFASYMTELYFETACFSDRPSGKPTIGEYVSAAFGVTRERFDALLCVVFGHRLAVRNGDIACKRCGMSRHFFQR